MPAKKQVTREKIVREAFALVREGGMDALNVTALSKRLGCSTQPVYLSFRNMDELKREVLIKIGEFCNGYLLERVEGVPPYKAMGINYIRLAREEKHFFQEVFMKGGNGELVSSATDNAIALVQGGTGLTKDLSARLHAEIWLFVHGVATALCTGYLELSDGQIGELLTDVYKGLTLRFEGGI